MAFSQLWCLGAGEPPGDEEAAYRLERGSVARSRMVALGRDLVVDGEALSHAVALSGSVRVGGRVTGDVIAVGGDVRLAETARVSGNVYALGGRIRAVEGAAIGGRSVSYPDASALWVMLIQGPALGLSAFSPAVLGAKLALLAFWALVVALGLAVAGRELVATSDGVRREPFRNFFLGLTGVVAMLLTALAASALVGAAIGLPLLALVAVVALGLRFWGMVAVFHALGAWLGERLGQRPPPVVAASYGLLVLGALKLLPWVGIWSWSLATFLGVGAALSTRLGRRERWLA